MQRDSLVLFMKTPPALRCSPHWRLPQERQAVCNIAKFTLPCIPYPALPSLPCLQVLLQALLQTPGWCWSPLPTGLPLPLPGASTWTW